VSDRSGCAVAELTVLDVLDAMIGRRPRAHVRSEKVLSGIDERIGLGPRYAYELLLDLARPWILPVPTVAVEGNYGDRGFPVPADPEYTHCRPSRAGQLVLDAEAGRLAPVPVGLINGTTYRGSTRPPLDPSAVLAALRRLLEDPGTPDGELISLAGPPWSGTGCTITGDLAALARGRRVVLRESGQITITGVPVPGEPVHARPAPADDVQYRSYAGGEASSGHLVIESLPARTVAAEVAEAIASQATLSAWAGPDADRVRRAALPVAQVDDQSAGAQVRIVLTLCPGADPAAVRDQLAAIGGIAAEAPCAFPAPLAGLLRSWVDDHRGEDIAASLAELENAIHHDRQRAQRNN
jgi:hypothetical protein